MHAVAGTLPNTLVIQTATCAEHDEYCEFHSTQNIICSLLK